MGSRWELITLVLPNGLDKLPSKYLFMHIDYRCLETWSEKLLPALFSR